MNARTDFLLHRKALSKRLGLLLLLGATLLWAGDKPWKAKPYQQWDEKDLQTILTDSPWARITLIQRTWLSVAEKDAAPDDQISGGVRQMPNASATGNAPLRVGEETWRQLNVQICWQSSRVMRAATAREAVLHGEKVDVDKYASEPQTEYEIVVRMQDMTHFRQHEEKFFQGNAFLQMK